MLSQPPAPGYAQRCATGEVPNPCRFRWAPASFAINGYGRLSLRRRDTCRSSSTIKKPAPKGAGPMARAVQAAGDNRGVSGSRRQR